MILLLTSCGKEEIKKVSEESKIANEVFRLAEVVKKAYLNNDRRELEKHLTSEGYRELIGGIKHFDKADLKFKPTWVDIRDSVVKLTISWQGTWFVDGVKRQERGTAVFIFEGRPLKLAKVLRSNPFRQPE